MGMLVESERLEADGRYQCKLMFIDTPRKYLRGADDASILMWLQWRKEGLVQACNGMVNQQFE